MKKYVKIVSLFLATLVMLSLTACGKQMSEEEIIGEQHQIAL